MIPPALSIPASVISFDDTTAQLGAPDLQQAMDILSARLARLEALAGGGELTFFDPADSGLIPTI